MGNHSSGRPAFTMIQLLVVLALLAFAFAFFLPALNRVRQAAARSQSQNNMRQIGIALHAFHDVNRIFPPALGAAQQAEGTLFFHILPYVEQAALYQKANGKVWNDGVYSTPVATYLSPSDKSAPPGNRHQGWLATCNYAANWQVFNDKGCMINDLTDGTSNTAVIAERYQVCNGHPNGWGYSSLYYWAPIFAHYSKARFQLQPTQAQCNPALPQSLQPTVIHVGMADGSVQSVSDNCSTGTWWSAIDPRDNMALGDDFN